MALSNKEILRGRDVDGTIVIEPFHLQNLSTSSYDVTLGKYYYREESLPMAAIYNPYDEEDVRRVWGKPQEASPAPSGLKNVRAGEDLIIWLSPGETILAHTEQFIGGKGNITTMMKARSSMGRNFIEVCKCAGWGDVGYTNRWTMEITNNSRCHKIPLVVGRRCAQIVFLKTGDTLSDNASYVVHGKYQTNSSDTDIESIKKSWEPSCMLPKMYLDREIQ